MAGLGIGFESISLSKVENNTLVTAENYDLAVLQGIDAADLTVNDFAFT